MTRETMSRAGSSGGAVCIFAAVMVRSGGMTMGQGTERDAALRALLADADAFGVMGWGAPKQEKAAEPKPALVDAPAELAKIGAEVCACRRCPLGSSRTNAVPGQGNPRAELMFVGEAPGA